MVLDISQIRALTCGAELVEQRQEGIRFQDMTWALPITAGIFWQPYATVTF
jgi:hypothetical protein